MKLMSFRLHLAILAAALLPAFAAQGQATSNPGQAPATAEAGAAPATPMAAPNPNAPNLIKPGSATGASAAKITPAQQAALDEVHKLAVLTLSYGGSKEQVIIKLEPGKAPRTVDNFIQNVEKGTYKGLAIHRAIPDYLVQTGDPASRSNDNRDQWGLGEEYTIPGEFGLPHISGSVAMARRSDKVNPDRKSNGTQFYFAIGNLTSLNGQYSVFGQVVSGLDVLKRISRSIRDTNDAPIERIEISEIKVIDHKGPIVKLTSTGSGEQKRRGTSKPDALKNPFEKFLDRVW